MYSFPLIKIILAAFAGLALAQEQNRIGVGFSLATDYGVASAHFENGTAIDIAKIEGSYQYKEYMKTLSKYEEPTTIPSPSSKFHLASIPCPLPRRLCKSWWFGSSPARPFESMLGALKAATEAILQTEIPGVLVTLSHWPQTEEGFEAAHREIEHALDVIGLERWYRTNANNAAALPKHFPDICDEEVNILMMEYTRSALSMHLWTMPFCSNEEARESYLPDVGYLTWGSSNSPDEYAKREAQLYRELRSITEMPYTVGEEYMDTVDMVVLWGEAGGDPRLNAVVKEVLLERNYTSHAVVLPITNVLNLPFLSSQTLARLALNAQLPWHLEL